MYLLIFEDGTLGKYKHINPEDYISCDNGILTIVDISDAENPTEYHDGIWIPIDSYD